MFHFGASYPFTLLDVVPERLLNFSFHFLDGLFHQPAEFDQEVPDALEFHSETVELGSHFALDLPHLLGSAISAAACAWRLTSVRRGLRGGVGPLLLQSD